MTEPTRRPQRQDPYAVFRPVRGARVAMAMAVASLVVFLAVALLSPAYEGRSAALEIINRGAIFGVGVLLAAGLWRYTRLRAIPTERGLTVVNLVRTRHVEWAEIVNVGLGSSAWAVLELWDTEELAVMAIQRSDGELARREVGRLAALVEHHHRPSEH